MKKGFTILEMILVLTVITTILLITLPNIAQKKEIIDDIACRALIEVVNGEILVYQLDGSKVKSIQDLVNAGLITSKQTVCPSGHKIEVENGQAVVK